MQLNVFRVFAESKTPSMKHIGIPDEFLVVSDKADLAEQFVIEKHKQKVHRVNTVGACELALKKEEEKKGKRNG